MRRLGFIYIGAVSLLLSACLPKDSVVEGGTEAVIEPEESPRDPDTVVCDPFDPDSSSETSRTQGVLGHLYYLDDTQPHYSKVSDYIEFGHAVTDIDLYFNQLYIPTRPFDRGFVTQGGYAITTLQGDTLYEWFALRFQGQIHLGSNDLPGDYQLALLSDDGSVWTLDANQDGEMELKVDNDGTHGTRMGCSNEKLSLQPGDKVAFQIDYYQGPRYHIALIPMWRPYPEDPAELVDPHCGMTSNTRYFDSTQNPPAPAQAYNDLLDRGWKPLTADNFSLPEQEGSNPCNQPAPVISSVAASQVQSTSVTLTWTTDIPANSQVLYRDVVFGDSFETAVDPEMVTQHSFQVTGLKSNTLYAFKVVSASVSGRSTESAELTLKTSR